MSRWTPPPPPPPHLVLHPSGDPGEIHSECLTWLSVCTAHSRRRGDVPLLNSLFNTGCKAALWNYLALPWEGERLGEWAVECGFPLTLGRGDEPHSQKCSYILCLFVIQYGILCISEVYQGWMATVGKLNVRAPSYWFAPGNALTKQQIPIIKNWWMPKMFVETFVSAVSYQIRFYACFVNEAHLE